MNDPYLFTISDLIISRKIPYEQIMVVYSWKPGAGYVVRKVHTNGRKFIIPILQKAEFVPRFERVLDFSIENVICSSMDSKLRIDIDFVARISSCIDYEGLDNAVKHQIGRSESEIDKMAVEIMDKHTRLRAKKLMAWKIQRDIDSLVEDVRKSAEEDMHIKGIKIKSLVIKHVDDKEGFLHSLAEMKVKDVQRKVYESMETGDPSRHQTY